MCLLGETSRANPALASKEFTMQTALSTELPMARINGVALHAEGARLTAEELNQRAYSELLRQTAIQKGLLDAVDAPNLDGVPSETASAAIEALLDQELVIPEPSEEACRRHHTEIGRAHV